MNNLSKVLTNRLANWLGLALAYARINLRAHLEYRSSFLSQAIGMALNNAIWLFFWTMFFKRFHVLHGWDSTDLITMWSVTSAAFGLASTFFGNALFLPAVIARGQLDAWFLYPRALLPHLVLGKMSATGWGDAIFGYLVYLAFVHPSLSQLLLFAVFTISAAVFFLGFFIFTGSLSFFIGNAELIAEQWRFSLITFSTYPASLFHGAVKIILYSLIPAGIISYMPTEALRNPSLASALFGLGSASVMLLVGTLTFYRGLRRYESGNLLDMKS
jgi:ABC-2 type transport system permease protein